MQMSGRLLGAATDVAFQRELESQGFVTVRAVVDVEQRLRLLRLLAPDQLIGATKHRSGVVFAARHLMATVPDLSAELLACGMDALASSLLGASAFPIDATYFDKQSTANWAVPVHQDRVLPVLPDTERSFRRARGVAVAEPTPSTLARLVALRIHFDATDGDTGALFVFPGSHRAGVLAPDQIKEVSLSSFAPCVADVGDVIAMRPLLLHRSPPSKGGGQRRVLHVVYASEQPDDGLRWGCLSGVPRVPEFESP